MGIEVSAETLHKAAGDVRSTREDVDGDLAKLWDLLDDLAIAWQGRASTGFNQLMQRWNEDVDKLLTAMDNIAEQLDSSGTTHTLADEEQEAMVNKFHQALG